MSETVEQPDTDTLESGARLLDRIAATPPQAEPVLLEARKAAESAVPKPKEPVIHSANEALNESME